MISGTRYEHECRLRQRGDESKKFRSEWDAVVEDLVVPRQSSLRSSPACMLALFYAIIASFILLPTKAAMPCNTTHNPCEDLLWVGSECRDGFCTNPFQKGCLRSLLQDDKYADTVRSDNVLAQMYRRIASTLRVCNSDDAPDAAEKGLCAENENQYSEVRIYSQNWESGIVSAWILQVLLSELLQVPATIETGKADVDLNFYDAFNAFGYGSANSFDCIKNAYDAPGGNCTVYKEEHRNAGEEYIPCAHVVPEVWFLYDELDSQINLGVTEPLELSGVIAVQSWYVTKYTIQKDPTLGTYFGLLGDGNRRKLAETFKRPTSWKEYCDSVSDNMCDSPDNVAERAPAKDGPEDDMYFAEGMYTGHFRATEQNDCNKTKACTGHIIDYPCGWTSYLKAQTRHLDIALESNGKEPICNGYTYSQIVEIWLAANATKSDLISLWYRPDTIFSTFQGTDAEMIPVVLPSSTDACLKNRVDPSYRCDENATESELYGNKLGSCGEPPVPLLKTVVGNMLSNIEVSETLLRSPAYDVMKDFTITATELEQINLELIYRGVDRSNFDPRFATCQWMAENVQQLASFIPESYPKVLNTSTPAKTPLQITALAVSSIAILITFATLGVVAYKQRMDNVSQIEFVLLLLAGFALVSVGSLLMALPPSNATCISTVWMINVGYTLELVPLLIKVSAVVRILQASKKMQRVYVNKKELIIRSLGWSAMIAVYCTLWIILDRPQQEKNLRATDDITEYGEHVVAFANSCSSDSNVWFYVSFLWQGLLLFGSSILAFQMRSAPSIIKETSVAVMIYTSFIFWVLRIILYFLAGSLSEGSPSQDSLTQATSLLHSFDTITNIIIYFHKILGLVLTPFLPPATQASYLLSSPLLDDTTI